MSTTLPPSLLRSGSSSFVDAVGALFTPTAPNAEVARLGEMAIPETYRTPHGLGEQLPDEISAVAPLTLGTIDLTDRPN
ncbi:MAG: hypothetical protein WAL25_05695 [Acidimicrobiia bacterium]